MFKFVNTEITINTPVSELIPPVKENITLKLKFPKLDITTSKLTKEPEPNSVKNPDILIPELL